MLRFAEPHIYTPVDDSLVLWISGRGRGVGSKVFDLSGKGNHGTIYGATWKNTPLGHSVLSFDGVDDYVKVPNSPSLDITSEVTIEAWIKANSWETTGGVGIGCFVWKMNTYGVVYETTKKVSGIFYRVGDDPLYIFPKSEVLNIKQWYYVVGVYDSRKAHTYVNGMLVNWANYQGTLVSSSNPLYIGGFPTARHFNGIIDEVRIYNRAFSAVEIRERFNMTKHLYGY